MTGQRTSRAAVIGAGSWGTALALVLARQGFEVVLWAYEPELVRALNEQRENGIYLPGFQLPAAIHATTDMADLATAELVLLAPPSHALRSVLTRCREMVPPEALVLLATKGLEEGSLMRASQVTAEVLGSQIRYRLATLSGPTFAREIAAGEPAAVVIAAEHVSVAKTLQQRLSSPKLRLYASSDVIGVELAGSLKNVIAIAAGICQGLGLGSNTRAALIARGLAEMTRLATAAGGEAETMAGLAGLGDLVLTCTGALSRNRRLGIALGEGQSLRAALASTPMVAEGVRTTSAALALSKRLGVEMPIAAQMHRVLFEQRPPRQALTELMLRPLTRE